VTVRVSHSCQGRQAGFQK